jgi:hypothetical protein
MDKVNKVDKIVVHNKERHNLYPSPVRVFTSRKTRQVKYLISMVRNGKCLQHFGLEILVTRMNTEK